MQQNNSLVCEKCYGMFQISYAGRIYLKFASENRVICADCNEKENDTQNVPDFLDKTVIL